MYEYDGQKRGKTPLYKSTIFWMCFIVLSLLALTAWYWNYGTVEFVEITVKDKEREVKSSNEKIKSKYIVHTEMESFECTDTWWHLKFNSTDVYRELEVGNRYVVKVNRFRVPILSWYRNIIYVREKK